ncbi:hypothetical protein SDC9_196769 [bioreactor metagenome]|uniref:Uncharacterized protein n=1 Tax=bioreactor metagenome TaxID=1076179 RepID=A0A645ICY0_9ZZZZ
MSASACSCVWYGRPYIRSRLKRSKCSPASCAARLASALPWMRPSALRCSSLKLWMPSDSRLTPAARKPANLPASTVPGLASSVISASGDNIASARKAPISSSMAPGDSRLGVPPPKNTVCTGRPQISGSADCRSAISASTYSRSGIVAPASCELKSQ